MASKTICRHMKGNVKSCLDSRTIIVWPEIIAVSRLYSVMARPGECFRLYESVDVAGCDARNTIKIPCCSFKFFCDSSEHKDHVEMICSKRGQLQLLSFLRVFENAKTS
jgi:hypothetical protein